ncbi:16S rRNA processing protein RimM [Parasphingopyxis algicola]|uniref:ribosome maturation factor RimM n=1 Tax=Parasphingopyxis algicola TaxID=2026624 RepID=UPI0015A00484|nr:ribosome maturation factor RimM [Parasphingopyxis algicola]QLC24285.1 16S rRNA processing protein RimM [Parasphingopyxis algicola]
MAEKRITLAAIAGAHGIGGEVRLKLFSESLDSFKRYTTFGADGQSLTLKSVRETGKMPIARFAEIADRTAAEALRGKELTVPRSALPPLEEGEYYHADIVGLPCVTESGDPVGEVIAVENFGAGNILEIRKPDGSDFMVPVRVEALTLGDPIIISPDFCDE